MSLLLKCKQNGKETDLWCTTKQLRLLITGRDIHILTRKRSCFNFVCTSQMYVHESWLIFQATSSISRVCVLLVLKITQCTVHRRQLPFYHFGGNNFDIFSLGLSLTNLRVTVWERWSSEITDKWYMHKPGSILENTP